MFMYLYILFLIYFVKSILVCVTVYDSCRFNNV